MINLIDEKNLSDGLSHLLNNILDAYRTDLSNRIEQSSRKILDEAELILNSEIMKRELVLVYVQVYGKKPKEKHVELLESIANDYAIKKTFPDMIKDSF